jgi:hypothetical protein
MTVKTIIITCKAFLRQVLHSRVLVNVSFLSSSFATQTSSINDNDGSERALAIINMVFAMVIQRAGCLSVRRPTGAVGQHRQSRVYGRIGTRYPMGVE